MTELGILDTARDVEALVQEADNVNQTESRLSTNAVTLKTKDVTNLLPNDIDLHLTAPGREEEIEAWKDVFGIEERYKAKFCGKNDGKAWLARIFDEPDNVGLTRAQLLAYEFRAADRSPYDSANFLRKPFLTACQSAKIISGRPPEDTGAMASAGRLSLPHGVNDAGCTASIS